MSLPSPAPTTAGTPRPFPILWPLLTIGIAYLFFFAGGYYGIYVVQVRMTSVIVSGAVLGAWLFAAWRSRRWPSASALWPALLTGVLALAVTTIFSRNARISLDFLAYGVLLAGLYVLLRTLLAGDLRGRLGATMVMLAFGIGVAYLVAVGSTWLTWWGVVGSLALPPLRPFYEGLTYGNPGLVAALAVLASIAASAHLGFGSWRVRVVVVLLWVLTATVVLVSGTRGAWIALAAMAVSAAAMPVASSARRRRVKDALRTRTGLGLFAVGVVLVVVVIALLGPTVVDRFVNSGEGGRTSYWAAAWRMFLEAPLTGVGPGMWAPQRILHTAAGEIDYYIPHAHNLLFQTLGEMGVVGMVGGVLVVAIAGRLVWRAARGTDAAARRWAAAAILGTVYFVVHQQVDLYVNMPAALFAFAFPFAWLDANQGAEPSALARVTGRIPRPAIRAGMAGAVIAAVAWGLASELAAFTLDATGASIDAGDWQRTAQLAADAVAVDPSMPPNQLALGVASARIGNVTGAREALEAVIRADDLPVAWIDLAWLQAQEGQSAAARDSLTQGLRLGQQQAAIALAAGYIYERLGDDQAADQEYVIALRARPGVASDRFWQDPVRAPRWPAMAAELAPTLDSSDLVDLYLALGNPTEARQAAATADDPAVASILQTVIEAWDGGTQAVARLDAQARANPRDVGLVDWLARIARRRGDESAAIGYRYWANALDPIGGPHGLEVAIDLDPGPGSSAAGATWGTYGIYTYRRPLSGDLLLPGLPLLVWVP